MGAREETAEEKGVVEDELGWEEGAEEGTEGGLWTGAAAAVSKGVMLQSQALLGGVAVFSASRADQ